MVQDVCALFPCPSPLPRPTEAVRVRPTGSASGREEAPPFEVRLEVLGHVGQHKGGERLLRPPPATASAQALDLPAQVAAGARLAAVVHEPCEEQARSGQEPFEHRSTTGAERVLGHVPVLLSYPG